MDLGSHVGAYTTADWTENLHSNHPHQLPDEPKRQLHARCFASSHHPSLSLLFVGLLSNAVSLAIRHDEGFSVMLA